MRRETYRSDRKSENQDLRYVRDALFRQAYPFARRAAQVRSAAASAAHAHLEREDVEQEVLVRIWIALARFDRRKASLRTFVERVAANSVASSLRRETAKKRTKSKDHDSVTESRPVLLQIEVRVDFHRALGRLSPTDRRVAGLIAEEGPARIARILRISRSAVYRSIGRIRVALMEAGFGQ